MRWLEHLIPPPLVALLIALGMWGLARTAAPLDVSYGLRVGVAVVLLALGLASAVSGFVTFRREGANIDPHKIDRGDVLVTRGIYRWTRNPMYLGATLVLCGYAAYLGRSISAIGPLCFVAFITRFQILPEERAMLAKFGARYEDYRHATRRWL